MTQHSLPELFVSRLQRLLSPQDFTSTLKSFDEPGDMAFRVNALKSTKVEVLAELNVPAIPLTWFEHAFTIPAEYREQLSFSPAFTEGRIYIQNPASMLAPLILNPQPNEEVLDLTAAPGGKTLMIAAMMNNQGRVAAVESVKGRFFRMKNNLETFGATMVDTYLKDGRQVGWKVPERFDRVLLDAPCSSESRFKTYQPDSFQHWNERKVKEVQRKQKKLICSAIAALKPGGVMVYSTCSYSPEENEQVVQHALKKFGDAIAIETVDLQLENFRPGLAEWNNRIFDNSIQQALRVLPTQQMHGFFLCKIRKHQSTAR